jgi:hypothetical protein
VTFRERAAGTAAVAVVFWAATRVTIALTVFLAGLIVSAADPAIAPLVERYGTLRGHLPRTRIGYFGPAGSTVPLLRRQMLARYTLAPALVDSSDAHELVLVDLDDDDALAVYVNRTGGHVRLHPRPGLALVERPGMAP